MENGRYLPTTPSYELGLLGQLPYHDLTFLRKLGEDLELCQSGASLVVRKFSLREGSVNGEILQGEEEAHWRESDQVARKIAISRVKECGVGGWSQRSQSFLSKKFSCR